MAAGEFGGTARPGPVAAAFDVWAAARASAEGIAARQRARLAALLQAAQRTPHYARVLRGRDPQRTPLSALPCTRKAELMGDFAARVADPALTLEGLRAFCADPRRIGQRYLGHYWVWESSGSSGEPAVFVHDEMAMAAYDALEASRRHSPRAWLRLVDPLFLGERFAFVGATGGHFASFVSLQRLHAANPWLVNWRAFSILQPTADLVQALDRFQPTLLASYPTAALLLAEEAAAGRLRCRPQEVWTGGETLTAPMRERIEEVFGATLRNSYGTSEFLPIAFECGHGQLHVNADWVILEPVDERGRPVPAGQPSHSSWLTNLANHVQPLIRIDIGDRITLGALRCPCGSALPVVQVQGRVDDAIVVPGRHGAPVTLLPLALATVLEAQAGVFDFELRQTGPRTLRLALGPRGAPDAGARERCRRLLATFMHDHGAAAPTLTVQPLDAPPQGRSGKVQRIVAWRA